MLCEYAPDISTVHKIINHHGQGTCYVFSSPVTSSGGHCLTVLMSKLDDDEWGILYLKGTVVITKSNFLVIRI